MWRFLETGLQLIVSPAAKVRPIRIAAKNMLIG